MNRLTILATALLATAQAFAARPIARWDVIPNQRFDKVFKAGVCAFHKSGVKVEFFANGALRHTAEKPEFNDRTGVWEYVMPLDPAAFPDGPVTLSAKVTALGSPADTHQLPDLLLYANAKGSLSVGGEVYVDSVNGDDAAEGSVKKPLKTLAAASKRVRNGGTVYLYKGVYSPVGFAAPGPYWTTIAAAPGVARDDVAVSGGRIADKLHFKGVDLFVEAEGKYAAVLSGLKRGTVCWVEDSRMSNRKGRWVGGVNAFGHAITAYVTGGETTEMNNGCNAQLVRGHSVHKIASDVWSGAGLVVNCKAWDIDRGPTAAHPDFHQSYARPPKWVHDVILYNVSGADAVCQGLFGVRLRDSAFVNVSFELRKGAVYRSQYSDEMENVLFAHVTLVNQVWLWRKTYKPKDVEVVNCLFLSMADSGVTWEPGKDLDVHDNAFYGGPMYGTNPLKVARPFADEANKNFALAPDSPAVRHGVTLPCVPADINGTLYPNGARPCGAYSTSTPKAKKGKGK